MAGEKHLRMTIYGTYTAGSEDAVEVWAMNIRQALVFGLIDDLGTFPSNWSVSPDFDTHTDTDWDTTRTFMVDGPGAETFDPAAYLNDYAGASWTNFMGAAGVSDKAKLVGIKLYPCDTSGNSIGGNLATLTYHTPVSGTDSSKMLPTENSAVVSWATNRLGPRGRGRVYPPVISVNALDNYGQLSDSWVSTYANAARATIEGMAYHGVGTGAPSVESVVTGPSSSGGLAPYTHYSVINACRVGKVVDTQRRRRNKLPELYVSQTIDQT